LVLHLPTDVHRRLRSRAVHANATVASYAGTLLTQQVMDVPHPPRTTEAAAAVPPSRSWLERLAVATGVAEVHPLGDPLLPWRAALERSRALEADGRRAFARLAKVATGSPNTGNPSEDRNAGHRVHEGAPSWGLWLTNDTFDEVGDLEARFLVERPAPHPAALRATYGDTIDSFPFAWPPSRDLAHRLFLLDHLQEIAQQLRVTLGRAYRMLAKCLDQHVSGAGSDLSPRALLQATRPQLLRNQRRPLDILRALVIDIVASFDEWMKWLELLETVPAQVRGRQKGGRRRKVPEPLRFAAYETATRLMRVHPRRPQKPTNADIVADTRTMLTTNGGWDSQRVSIGNVRDAIKREHARRHPSERAVRT
jgi:hypothetical protein